LLKGTAQAEEDNHATGLSNYVQEPQTEVFATQAEPIEPFANEPQDHHQDCSG